MTLNPECATIDTPIVDALHTMHNRKFLHLPVVDRSNIFMYIIMKIKIFSCFVVLDSDVLECLNADGNIVAVVDVIHITHAAVATVSRFHTFP